MKMDGIVNFKGPYKLVMLKFIVMFKNNSVIKDTTASLKNNKSRILLIMQFGFDKKKCKLQLYVIDFLKKKKIQRKLKIY